MKDDKKTPNNEAITFTNNVLDFSSVVGRTPKINAASFMPASNLSFVQQMADKLYINNPILKMANDLQNPILSSVKDLEKLSQPILNNLNADFIPALNTSVMRNYLPENKSFFTGDYFNSTMKTATDLSKSFQYSNPLLDAVKSFNTDSLLGGKSASYWNNELTSASLALKDTMADFDFTPPTAPFKPTAPAVITAPMRLVDPPKPANLEIIKKHDDTIELLTKQLEESKLIIAGLRTVGEAITKSNENLAVINIALANSFVESKKRAVRADRVSRRRFKYTERESAKKHIHLLFFTIIGIGIAAAPFIIKPTPAEINPQQIERLIEKLDKTEAMKAENIRLSRENLKLKKAQIKKKKETNYLTDEDGSPLTTEGGHRITTK